ncbi:MAG: hypothetical protein RL151_683 [Bacteroidota bacterium]
MVNLRVLIILVLSLQGAMLSAQELPPIGIWREHLPFNNALQVAVDGSEVLCATPYGFFRYDTQAGSFSRLTKVNGLSEVRVRKMSREVAGKRVVLVYENGNVDLIEGTRVRNIPDLMLSSVPGDKTCHAVVWQGNDIMLATGLGIVVLNPDRREVKDTWRPSSNGGNIPVYDLLRTNDSLYAATAEGLKVAPANGVNLADPRLWQRISQPGFPTGAVSHVEIIGQTLAAAIRDTLYLRQDGRWLAVWLGGNIMGMDVSGGQLFVCLGGSGKPSVVRIDARGQIQQKLEYADLSAPRQTVFQGNTHWIADQNNGLIRISDGKSTRVFPNSPINTAAGDLIVFNQEVWAAAGSVNEAWNYMYNPNGIYRLKDESWSNINLYVQPRLDSLLDLVSLAGDPVSGSLFAGSFGGGLLEITSKNEMRVYKQGTGLQETVGDRGSYRVSGLAVDKDGTLWISNYGAPKNLVARKKDGQWVSFAIPFLHSENAVSQILIDEFGYKWIVSPKGNGLFCYDDRGTPDNPSDDRWRYLRQGVGQGNLPSSTVSCIALDRDGFLWVGTSKGVCVIECLEDPFSGRCEAFQPVVQFDRFAGLLFGDEDVRTMAVDGANRKWIGSQNGVWLVSADGSKVIHRFSDRNSPLLNNMVHRIAVAPLTGEVFISTFDGICSFRGSATEAEASAGKVLVFPNPVPPGYSGMIAIRGLMRDGIVKITEPDGRLVYQTRALGGQAVWNGRNYRGERVSSGVYLVIAADDTGRERMVTKVFIVR